MEQIRQLVWERLKNFQQLWNPLQKRRRHQKIERNLKNKQPLQEFWIRQNIKRSLNNGAETSSLFPYRTRPRSQKNQTSKVLRYTL